MRIRSQLINEETGEVVSEETSTFTNAMSEEGYRFPSHKMGARMFSEVKFPIDMSHADIGRMTILSKLMVGKTNMLGYRQGRTILGYTGREIAELVDLQRRQGATFIDKMLRLRVLQKIITNSGYQYYVNPAYFMANGQRLSLDLFLLFRVELTPIVPGWVINEFLAQAHVKGISVKELNQGHQLAIEIAERILKEKRGIDGH